MSYIFDAALYLIAIASVLALYGSASKASAVPAPAPVAAPPAPAPAPAEPALADFEAELPAALEIPEEAIAQLLTEIGFEQPTPAPAPPAPVSEDVIVPFVRKRPQPAPADDLETLGVRALRAIASDLKISKYSRKLKAQLIAEIREARALRAA